MVFRSIEKPPSPEEKGLEEESMGGPWDKNYEGQFDVVEEEEKTDLVNPLKEINREEILGKTVKENPPVGSLPFAELLEEEKERFLKNAIGGKGESNREAASERVIKETEEFLEENITEEDVNKIMDSVKRRRKTQAEI